ncbi:MAG: DegT/DnrJ/EryC1/StrS family aminotransferase [Desulfobacteraceae bacterium]|nr:MAG: DegT/DnrJ/EryC1/StrS family aminotransferase [Desulfobacteraceae bacterium]
MEIPFLDLNAQYVSIKNDIHKAIDDVLNSCAFAGGPFVESFETEFASFCGCSEAIGVGNGTDALWLSLLALGVGPGHEVITVPNTFIATAEAISFCGATPVFVDVEASTYTINPELLENAITSKTRAIIPVHLNGQMADMDPIMEIAHKHGLFVVEDACQAHGAEYKGKRAGAIGNTGCFSFYPGKNLGAYGEAGAIVTNDADLAKKIRVLRDHGQEKKYHHSVIGWNARMDGLQGAILSVKLKHLPKWNTLRRQHARTYSERLGDIDQVILPLEAENRKHVFHIYAIRTKHRDTLMEYLKINGIQCGVHYPVPIHKQEAYSFNGYQNKQYPVAETVASELVSLPMYPELTGSMIETVCAEIKSWCNCGKIKNHEK